MEALEKDMFQYQFLALGDEAKGFQRVPPSKARRRIVLKNGNCNIHRPEAKSQNLVFLRFTKLVDSSWLYTIFIFFLAMAAFWVLFAVIWWLICYAHGDFDPDHLPQFQEENSFTPCVYHMENFASCLLFSIETQHTVGYGLRATTEECPEAIFVNALQCIIGFILQGIMAVTIFSKMTLPRLRSQTLLFSRNAVISQRKDKLCLMFRFGDMRKDHIIETRVRLFFIRSERTVEGQVLDHHQTELTVSVDGCKEGIFFNWPLVAFHEIDENSPLYFLVPNDLNHNSFELVVFLEGTTQSTDQMTQARTSYLPTEIVWGKSFQSLLGYNADSRGFEADFSKFDEIFSVPTPLCSAAYLDHCKRMHFDSSYSPSSRHSLEENGNVFSIGSSGNESESDHEMNRTWLSIKL